MIQVPQKVVPQELQTEKKYEDNWEKIFGKKKEKKDEKKNSDS